MLDKVPRWMILLIVGCLWLVSQWAVPQVFGNAESRISANSSEIVLVKGVAYTARNSAERAEAGVARLEENFKIVQAAFEKSGDQYREDRNRDEQNRREDQARLNQKLDLLILKQNR